MEQGRKKLTTNQCVDLRTMIGYGGFDGPRRFTEAESLDGLYL